MSRVAPRDLYGVHAMVEREIISDRNLFRKCFVFYNACGGNEDADNIDFDKLDKFNCNMVRRQLKPLLAKSDMFDISVAIPIVKEYLSSALALSDREKEFVELFRKKKYKPDLLFDNQEILQRIQSHSMVLWRLRQELKSSV